MVKKPSWVESLRAKGIIDGVWTLTASLGSKIQMLVLLVLVTRFYDVAETGRVVLALSTCILISALLDMGLSTQVARSFAGGMMSDRDDVLRPLSLRLLFLAPASAVTLSFILGMHLGAQDLWFWCLAGAFYATGYQAGAVATQLAYGLFRFRSGATLNGVVRVASVPVLLLVAIGHTNAAAFLAVIGLAEWIIAVFQYRLASRSDASRSTSTRLPRTPDLLRIRNTWKFGVGGIANNVMNRSDTVAVSILTSASVVGVYGLASQMENALTTAALVPAGAVVAYTARLNQKHHARALARSVGFAVGGVYVLLAIPFLLFTKPLIGLVFGAAVKEVLPFQICVVAGLFSCLSGLAMQQMEGLGLQCRVAVIWIGTALIAVGALMSGAAVGGAAGAAVGALIRDVVFFTAAWTVFWRSSRKRVSGMVTDNAS